MEIIDISMTISHDMPVYKGRASKRPILSRDADFESGQVFETRLEMNLHTGTHVDAPLHILRNGPSLDEIPLNRVITRCKVLDLCDVNGRISSEELSRKNIEKGDFLLLKTRNSLENILERDFVYLDQQGARYLCGKGIAGVGIDALGIERSQPGHETHKLLFEAGIIILEGLTLTEAEEGEYLLLAVPIKIKGVEASPVRAVLIKDFEGFS